MQQAIHEEFVLTPAQWPAGTRTLTYSFVESGSLSSLTDENRWEELSFLQFGEDPFDPIDFRAVFREAVGAWEAVSGVDLVEVPDGPEVNVRVGWQWLTAQGDNPSDGPGGTLGVATHWFVGNTRTEAVIAFDPDDFRYTSLSPNAAGRNPDAFYDTALHEIGHALGIGHSDVPNVVMSGLPVTPYWNPPGRDPLQPDDIAAIQALWGAPGGRPQAPRYDNVVAGTPDIDRLYGTEGNDVLTGGAGRDLLAGGGGDDLLIGGSEGATLFGQGGADTFIFTGGRNWFMDFDPSEGDRIGGLDQPYIDANGQTLQAGEHFALYFGDSPWGDDADVIWLADTTGMPEGDYLLG